MGSVNRHRVFNPLDLEVIDYAYETVWAQVEARGPLRDRERDEERQRQYVSGYLRSQAAVQSTSTFSATNLSRLCRKVGFQLGHHVARLPKPLCDAAESPDQKRS